MPGSPYTRGYSGGGTKQFFAPPLSSQSVRISRNFINSTPDRNPLTSVPFHSTRWKQLERSHVPAQNTRPIAPMEAYSVVGSDSSLVSNASFRTSKSHISVDSRGRRRGRTCWKGAESSPTRITLPSSSSTKSKRYICTWPDCDKRFPNKSGWVRHEKSVHYQPDHWICCLESEVVVRLPHCPVCGEQDVLMSHLVDSHFFVCAQTPEKARTFMRRDQLSQHIKGVHLKRKGAGVFMSQILSAWKKSNPLPPEALHCRFCGSTFDTWKERQRHVFGHIKSGYGK